MVRQDIAASVDAEVTAALMLQHSMDLVRKERTDTLHFQRGVCYFLNSGILRNINDL